MRFGSTVMMAVCTFAFVAGCTTPEPDHQPGVGFGNYADYEAERQRRNAELRGESLPPRISSEVPAPASTELSTEELLQSAEAAVGGEAPTQESPRLIGQPDNAGISDEQDFSAVSGRETIESDAERIAANRANYEVIAPTAVPTRTGSGGPNLVEFALQTNNAVGEQVHSRTNLLAGSRYERNCAKYASPDLAQMAFLRAGGPQRDRMGIDPDGDGYACHWDPTAFRNVNRAGGN